MNEFVELYDERVARILQAKELYKKQVEKLNEQQLIAEAVKRDCFDKVRNCPTRYDQSYDLIKEAMKEIHNPDITNKEHLEMLSGMIHSDFFPRRFRDFKITNLHWIGMGEYYLTVEFPIGEKTYVIGIPMRRRLEVNDIDHYTGEFYFHERGSSTMIVRTYDMYEIFAYLNNFIN